MKSLGFFNSNVKVNAVRVLFPNLPILNVLGLHGKAWYWGGYRGGFHEKLLDASPL